MSGEGGEDEDEDEGEWQENSLPRTFNSQDQSLNVLRRLLLSLSITGTADRASTKHCRRGVGEWNAGIVRVMVEIGGMDDGE